MTIKRISDKRLKKLGKLPFSTISKKPKPIRKRPRKPSETLRIYGGKKRIEWVKSQPCAVATRWCVGAIHNAHIETGGMGRKADYDKIIPLCQFHHQMYDEAPMTFNWCFPDFNPEDAARSTNEAWIAYSGSSPISASGPLHGDGSGVLRVGSDE